MPRPLTSLVVLALACAAVPAQEPSPSDWIRANAIPLTTVEAGHGFADMQPLKDLIGSARIVSLGEATHGTREFFQLKHRMLEFLASEMGFTIFSIEANMPEAYRLSDYVLHGVGDPAQLLKGMYFWTWDTSEVLAMIHWMRDFNESGRGRIEFTGFDMQTPTIALKDAGVFVSRYDKPYAETMLAAMTQVLQVTSASSQVDLRQGIAQLRDVAAHFEAGRTGYRASGASETDIDWAIQNVRVALQGLQMRARDVSRDRSMAENVKWIVDQNPDAKIVLWAHNGHVATGGGFAGVPMGAILREMFGQELFVFGFAFNQGAFRAMPQGGRGLKAFAVPPLQAGSLDATLAKAALPVFALDLRSAPTWFSEPHGTREIGSRYPDDVPDAFVTQLRASDAFDAMLFVESTTAARANPR